MKLFLPMLMFPVPADAPEPDFTHPQHGKASVFYSYRQADGQLLFYVARFDKADGTKQFSPLSCVQYETGSIGWAWKAPPSPRPLYGLELLAQRTDAPVLVVEGEKTADAARLLFSDYVVVAWMNGASAVDHVDVTPLMDRHVTLWPDNDKQGCAAMEKLAVALLATKAKHVALVEVPSDWPAKWDLADPFPLNAANDCAREMLKAAVAVTDNWGELDLSLLNENRRDPPPFPLSVLGPWRAWVEAAAESKSAPNDYVVMPLLIATASLIGNSRVASAFNDSWQEPAVLWGCSIGDPSSGKSPAADPIVSALRQLQRDAGKDFDHSHREWETKAAVAKLRFEDWQRSVGSAANEGGLAPIRPEDTFAPQEPKCLRLIVHDVTPEAVPHIANANPRGIALFRDELTAWFDSFNRYSSGSSPQAFWLELFGARPFTVDRVPPRPSIHIPRFGVSIHGNIQPDNVRKLLAKENDGMLARFLVAWPQSFPPRRPTNRLDMRFILNAFERIYSIPLIIDGGEVVPMPVSLEPDAETTFHSWRETLYEEQQYLPPRLQSAYGKLPGVILRVALVLEHMWWSAGTSSIAPVTITPEGINAAILYVDDYLKPMIARVYGSGASTPSEHNAAMLLKYVVRNKLSQINKREIRDSALLPGLYTKEDIEEAFERAVECNAIRPAAHIRSVGRPRGDYDVNPALLI